MVAKQALRDACFADVQNEVTDTAVDKLYAAIGGTLSLKAILAAENHVVAGCISKVGFGVGRHSWSLLPHPWHRHFFALGTYKTGASAPAR